MATKLKIGLGGNRKSVSPHWTAAILELRDRDSGKLLQFALEDFARHVVDDPKRGIACFEVPHVPEGRYEITVRDIHMGRSLFHAEDFVVEGEECFFQGFVEEFLRTRQANTYAMDLVVDAPYRLQKSCLHLPVIIYIKDVTTGKMRIESVDFLTYDPTAVGDYRKLPAGCIHRVLDRDGSEIMENGVPGVLRFDPEKNYETVKTDPWYRIVLLSREKLPVLQGKHAGYENARYLQYQVRVKYNKWGPESKRFVLRTLTPEEDLPATQDWYYGDTHYHSDFTDNPYEFGGPPAMTAEVAQAVGLSWITVTDHSYCLNHPKTSKEKAEGNRWESYHREIRKTNKRYPNVLLTAAEEITVRKNLAGLHLLSFGNPFVEDEHPAGFGSVTLEEVFERIRGPEDEKGFIYAAHPSSEGYTWGVEDYNTALDPKNRDYFAGLQVFNEKIFYKRITESMDRDLLDPFDMIRENDRRRPWSKELREGIDEHWVKKFLVPSMRDLDQGLALKKYFVLAGSDAHMDFNCSFRPHPAFLIHYLNDNALGKVRTLAYLPQKNRKALTEKNLYDALRNGRTLLTDGPIVLFTLSLEGDSRTFRLGDTLVMPPGGKLKVSIEWTSTSEFRPVGDIRMYRGTGAGEEDITDRLGLPVGDKGMKGRRDRVFETWIEMPCYLRLEASAGADPESGEGLFLCVTNPIWIVRT